MAIMRVQVQHQAEELPQGAVRSANVCFEASTAAAATPDLAPGAMTRKHTHALREHTVSSQIVQEPPLRARACSRCCAV
jgi:hypothetical protein